MSEIPPGMREGNWGPPLLKGEMEKGDDIVWKSPPKQMQKLNCHCNSVKRWDL
jgi:hypothetical protein